MDDTTDVPGCIPLVDVHAHILPGIDDGARDAAEAVAMLRAAVDDGIATIVATPHAHHTTPDAIRSVVASMSEQAASRALPVRILAGCEIRIGPDMVDRLQNGQLLTLNDTRYVLIELHLHDEWPLPLVLRALDRLRDAGYWPILAHAERYTFVQREPSALVPFTERGILVQMNAAALMFQPHDPERLAAEALVRARTVHLVASDAHNSRYRPPRLRDALHRVGHLTDCGYAECLAKAAQRVIAGEPME